MSQLDNRPPSRGEEIANEIVVAFAADDTDDILSAASIVASRMLDIYGAPLDVTLEAWRAISGMVEQQITWGCTRDGR